MLHKPARQVMLWHKKCAPKGAFLMRFLFTETITAINGAVIAGLKGNFAGFATFGANGVEHLALAALAATAPVCFAGIAAIFATLGFIGETFFSVEFLLIGGENELGATVFAGDSFVLEH